MEIANIVSELDDPRSLRILVNKKRPLQPITWEPEDLVMPVGVDNVHGQPVREAAARALETMFAAATAAGLPFMVTSAYRSFEYQRGLFERYTQRDGVEAAETYSARAGHSEHQTGLAVDLDDGSGHAFTSEFGETETGLWLREHCAEFGFILRYDQGEQHVVGYIYEPWHFRYLGTEIALDMRDKGIKNYEDYVGAEPAPDYAS